MNNEMLDPHLTTKIVSSYVRHHTVGADQVSDLITSVHQALGRLGQPVQTQEVLTPAVSVRRSVHHDYVVCLDCGHRGKTLKRHISIRHGLTRDDYLKRWGLKSDHPLTAPAYSERRSTMAQALGFGRRSKAAVISATTPAVSVSKGAGSKSGERVARRRSTRSASK
jgi:predicted transcriptional regulator